MSDFDPNGKAVADDGIFGLPFKEVDAQVVYLPIPWEVTTSYRTGTAKGPKAILNASPQIDFYDLEYQKAYKVGLFMAHESAFIHEANKRGRKLAEKIINADESEIKISGSLQKKLQEVNKLSSEINQLVYDWSKDLLNKGKSPIVVGGDHSTPLGAIKAYAEKYPQMGVLHIDAHSDTRQAYMGFEYSHASIMYNVMAEIPAVSKLVQMGIRDFCEEEFEFNRQHEKIETFFDYHIQKRKLQGESFDSIASEIIEKLPNEVYISFDIDGLDPRFCPHTGTAVPGGLDFNEILLVFQKIVASGRTIVGFDLVEVAPSFNKWDEWDANVGMRMLYKMTGAMLASQKKIERMS